MTATHRVNIMLEIKQREALKVTPDHWMDKTAGSVMDGETMARRRMFAELMLLGAEWTERCE